MSIKLSVEGNKNYCASIVEIQNIIELESCQNIQGTTIQGNHVIISKDIKVGDTGVFFPVECSIKDNFLKVNNLYREKTLNVDQTKAGFFEINGRVRCMKLRGFKSEGLFLPLQCLISFCNKIGDIHTIQVGTDFDHIDGQMICEKYIVKSKQVQNVSKKDKKSNIKKISKLLDGYFRLHIDTEQFGKNLNKFKLGDLISITTKIHGCSFISSNILCKRKLTIKDKIAKFLGVNVIETEYDNIYSSRRVIKNEFEDNKPTHYYNEDIWGVVNSELKDLLNNGMTIYGEVCGYLKDGRFIQKPYDYGCNIGQHDIYVYRITYTDFSGKVFEWSMKQVQDWCLEKGIKAVPLLYYGTVKNFILSSGDNGSFIDNENYQNQFLDIIKNNYLEKECNICKSKVPSEGVCIRREVNDIDVYKAKSFAFRNFESLQMDKGEVDIEEQTIG